MSRREQIKMSAEEVASFLAQERTVTCATVGPRGWPHLMPLWYVLRDQAAFFEREASTVDAPPPRVTGDAPDLRTTMDAPPPRTTADAPGPRIWAWTYAKSQKVRNLERDVRVTLQVEAGEQYQELRGVMFECDVVIHRDLDTVGALGQEIFKRYASPRGEPPVGELAPEVSAMVEQQAAKRVGLEFIERRRASWDHRKLGGVY